MKTTSFFQATFSLLVATALAGASTGDPAVLVAAAGSTYLNGRAINSGIMAHSGDVFITLPDGSMTLQFDHGQIALGHKTRLSLTHAGAEVGRGYLRVQGRVGVSDGVHRIVELGNDADYELVAFRNGQIYLHAFAGTIQLTGFAQPYELHAGHAVTYSIDRAGLLKQDISTQQPQSGAAPAQTAGPDTQGKEQAPQTTSAPNSSEQNKTGESTTTDTSVEVIPPTQDQGAKPAATQGTGMPTPVLVGIVAAAAITAGLILHGSSSSTSPSTP